jgi:branched-chain amino acid transport system ATP-binding protein
VQGIDIEAAAGEVIGIFGRNGVGKTTLMKTIAGWLKPTTG